MALRRSGTAGPMFEAAVGPIGLTGDAEGPSNANTVRHLTDVGGANPGVPIDALVPAVADRPLVLTPGNTIEARDYPSAIALAGDASGPSNANLVRSLSEFGLGNTGVPIDALVPGLADRPLVLTPGNTIETRDYPPSASGQAQYLPVDADTVGCWTLNRTPADSSGAGNNLTPNGLEAYSPMAPGLWGAVFNGSSIWYQTANVAAVQLAGAMTLQMIVMSPTLVPLPAGRTLAGCRDATGAGDLLYTLITTTAPTLRTQYTGGGATPTKNLLLCPTPTLLTMTRDPGIRNDLYVNDQLVATGTGAVPAANANAHLTIGRDPRDALPMGYFDGWACGVRLKNVFSDSDQVKADYDASLGPLLGIAP